MSRGCILINSIVHHADVKHCWPFLFSFCLFLWLLLTSQLFNQQKCSINLIDGDIILNSREPLIGCNRVSHPLLFLRYVSSNHTEIIVNSLSPPFLFIDYFSFY